MKALRLPPVGSAQQRQVEWQACGASVLPAPSVCCFTLAGTPCPFDCLPPPLPPLCPLRHSLSLTLSPGLI